MGRDYEVEIPQKKISSEDKKMEEEKNKMEIENSHKYFEKKPEEEFSMEKLVPKDGKFFFFFCC